MKSANFSLVPLGNLSLPVWGRGLKLYLAYYISPLNLSLPMCVAWIEIFHCDRGLEQFMVAPRVGGVG